MEKVCLEQYRSGGANRYTCPQCGKRKCFTRYVYTDTGEYIDETVGKCDHDLSCGYHYPPSAFFRDHPDMRRGIPQVKDYMFDTNHSQLHSSKPRLSSCQPRPLDTIPSEYVTRSKSTRSEFVNWLSTLFPDKETLMKVINDYHIGATRDGAVIFWQIDKAGRVRSGKIMHYDCDGHRRGAPFWTHSILKKTRILTDDWKLTQCFFGEHLLSQPDRTVALVESEKTAIVCALFCPEYIWLATGGCKQLSSAKCEVLKGRKVIIFPDSGVYDEWVEKMKATSDINYIISDKMEGLPPNIDLADLFVKHIISERERGNMALSSSQKTSAVYPPIEWPFEPWDGIECPF